MSGSGPLEGIRVLDNSQGAQGPWAGALLGDLGADVIKIERPEGDFMRHGSGIALPHSGMNHGKRNIMLDVKQPEDMETMLALVRTADVFLENWRGGVADRIGLGYETLRRVNPRIVYCSATGFGDGGVYGPLPSMDGFSQAMAGYYSITGPQGGVGERPRTQVIDFTSPLTVIQAIMMGLITREQTGESQWVRCSQMRTLISLSQVRAAEYFASGEVPQPWGSASPYAVPSQAFRTADKYVMVDCRDDEDWRAFCDAIELAALADDERFATNASRVAHRDTLLPLIERAMLRFEGDRWLSKLHAAGVPCSPVNIDIENVFEDAQVVANDLVVERTHPSIPFAVKTTPIPWTFSRTPVAYGPLQGPMNEHRESILADAQAGRTGAPDGRAASG